MSILHRLALLLLFVGPVACAADPAEPRVKSGSVRSADGVTIAYDVRGTGDMALVLVHGWTNSRAIWGKHPDTLSRTHPVVTLDLAGHGISGADRRDWTVDAFGEDVVAVVERLSLERVVLVGFSMGGGVTLEAAERLGDRVLGVVFVDTIKDPDFIPSDANLERVEAGFRANWGDPEFVRSFGFAPDAPETLIEHVVEMMPEEPHEHWFKVLHSYHAWLKSELKPTLQRIEVPIAAINRSHPPTNVEAMQRYAPSFAVDTIDGVGHAGILLRRIDEFDVLLLAHVERFVAGQAASRSE